MIKDKQLFQIYLTNDFLRFNFIIVKPVLVHMDMAKYA
jgi:hypothetical protein